MTIAPIDPVKTAIRIVSTVKLDSIEFLNRIKFLANGYMNMI